MSLLQVFVELLVAIIRMLLNPVFLIPILVFAAVQLIFLFRRWKENQEYKKSAYHQITHLSFREVRKDKGRYGEYLTYKHLQHYEQKGARFLFNVYVPKGQDETTEIDVLMICAKGLFVIESKNYSGWIFGDESRKQWCQSFAVGRRKSHKEYFYNPIMQNRSHMKHLKTLLGDHVPMHSVIVFSDQCKLKDLRVRSDDVRVVDWNGVEDAVHGVWHRTPEDLLDPGMIAQIYDKLYPSTQVDAATKEKHIEDIRRKQGSRVCGDISPIVEPVASVSETVSATEAEVPATDDTSDQETVIVPADGSSGAGLDEVPVDIVPDDGGSAAVEPPVIQEVGSERMEGSGERPQDQKCPRCGGSLVLRTAAKGAYAGSQFYGCANFPKCRYTRK